MAKVPRLPDLEVLAGLEPDLKVLDAGTEMWRVYFRGGNHPTRWNEFRSVGPLDARFDHLEKGEDARAVVYLARHPVTCLAEVFQKPRTINRKHRVPWLVGFELGSSVALLDLTGSFATRIGASMGLMTGARSVSCNWAKGLYETYPDTHGILYPSSMHGNRAAVVLNERARVKKIMPASPMFHRSLDDAALMSVVKNAGRELGFVVR